MITVVPLPYTMASQGNHWAGACYQLPVLDEKCSCWVFWHVGTHRNLKSWGTLSASCTAHTVSAGSWYRSALISGCISWGTSFFEGFCFLPYSTKEKDFVSGKQLLTFAWHLSKIQTFVKFHTFSKAFHFQQLKCGKIPHFLRSVPKPSQLLFRTRLWEHRVFVCGIPSICTEQHQPPRHLGGSPRPKAEELQGNHFCSSPSKPTWDKYGNWQQVPCPSSTSIQAAWSVLRDTPGLMKRLVEAAG